MQSVYSGGLRCRFGDKTHLTAMYQYTDYNDKQINNAPYQIGQFALLFNMTF